MSNERLPVQHGDQAPAFDHRSTSPMVRRGLARFSVVAATEHRSADIALRQDERPVLLWSFKGYGDKGDGTGVTRPPMLTLIPEAIPRDLFERRQWVCWDTWGSLPISPITGDGSSVDPPWECFEGKPVEVIAPPVDPRTWGSFEEAQAFAAQYGLPGIGFVLSGEDPYTVIEFYQCRNSETGALDPWALRIVASLNSYTELSADGRGLHVIVRGTLPPFDPCNRRFHPALYDRDWYVKCTGHHLAGTPTTIQDRQTELEMLLREPAEVTSIPLGRSDGGALALEVATTDLVVVITWGLWLRPLDGYTGAERWCSWLPFGGSTQIVRGVLYISDYADNLTAKDLQTGEDRWSFHPGDQATSNWYDGTIYVLDVVTGEERCRCRTWDDSRALLPPPTDDVIYVSNGDYIDMLHVLDAVEAWDRYERAHLSNLLEVVTGASRGPSEAQDRILLDFWGTPDTGFHRVTAVDSTTGAERWRLEGIFRDYETLERYGMIYISLEGRGPDSCVVALDADTGTERWSWYGGSRLIAATHGVIYTCDHFVGDRSDFDDDDFRWHGAEGDVVALDAMSGETVWSFKTRAIPILTDDTAYIVNRGVLHALDIRTGYERWQLTIQDRIDDEDADPKALSLAAELATTPEVQVVGGMIYASTGYTLFAFREPRIARE